VIARLEAWHLSANQALLLSGRNGVATRRASRWSGPSVRRWPRCSLRI